LKKFSFTGIKFIGTFLENEITDIIVALSY